MALHAWFDVDSCDEDLVRRDAIHPKEVRDREAWVLCTSDISSVEEFDFF